MKFTDVDWIMLMARSRPAMKLVAWGTTIGMVTAHIIADRYGATGIAEMFGADLAHWFWVVHWVLVVLCPTSLIVLANTPPPPLDGASGAGHSGHP